MAGKGMVGEKSRRPRGKKMFYVYFPQGDRLVLYYTKILDPGARRIVDLTLHLLGVEKLCRAESAFIVSGSLQDPPQVLDIGKNPDPDDFERYNLKFHHRRDL